MQNDDKVCPHASNKKKGKMYARNCSGIPNFYFMAICFKNCSLAKLSLSGRPDWRKSSVGNSILWKLLLTLIVQLASTKRWVPVDHALCRKRLHVTLFLHETNLCIYIYICIYIYVCIALICLGQFLGCYCWQARSLQAHPWSLWICVSIPHLFAFRCLESQRWQSLLQRRGQCVRLIHLGQFVVYSVFPTRL